MDSLVTIYAYVVSDGAGSAYIEWYKYESDAKDAYNAEDEPFGEETIYPVETFVGSNVYNKAQ